MKWEYCMLSSEKISIVFMRTEGPQKLTVANKNYKGATGKDIVDGATWESQHLEHKHDEKILTMEAESPNLLMFNTWAVLGELGWEAYAADSSTQYFKRPIKE